MTETRITYPTQASLAETSRRFYRYGLIRQGVPASSADKALGKNGEKDLFIGLICTLQVQVYANERALEDAYLADTSTGDDLTRLSGVYGLDRSTGSKSTGSIVLACSGSVDIDVGDQLTSVKTGKRYEVITAYTSVTTGTLIAVRSIDTGALNDLAAGQVLTWTEPPSGVASSATVDVDGLVGGVAADTDSSLRTKLLRRLRKPQNGGSWAHVKQWIEDSSADVLEAFVFPALQGPATTHAAFGIAGTAANNYSREPSDALLVSVTATVLEQWPEHSDLTLTGWAHEDLSLALRCTLPEPASANGLGGGWIDPSSGTVSRWPTILASGLPVRVTTATSSTVFVVNATAAPIAGASVDFFDSTNLEFLRAKVLSSSGTSGAYTITVDTSLPTILAGDYLCPASEQSAEYARVLCESIAKLGPGQKTADAAILARAYRHPRNGEGSSSGVDTAILAAVQTERHEVTGLRFSAINLSATPTYPVEPSVVADVDDPPNVWRLKRLGLYP